LRLWELQSKALAFLGCTDFQAANISRWALAHGSGGTGRERVPANVRRTGGFVDPAQLLA
jgi:hypothetical protein